MARLISIVTAFSIVSGAATASAASLVVAVPDTQGVDAAPAEVFAELLRGELSKKSALGEVVSRSQTPTTPCGDPACAGKIATEAGAERAVAVSMMKLGNKIILQSYLADADGRSVFSDRSTAANVDDLEPLAVRVAAALIAQKPSSETATTASVTQQERVNYSLRRKTHFTSGARLGALVPPSSSFGGTSHLAVLGFTGQYEIENYTLDLGLDILWTPSGVAGSSAGGAGFNMGAKRYFSNLDFSPFVGAGFGYRGLHASYSAASDFDPTYTEDVSDSADGFGAYLGGGATLFRTHDTHLTADLRYDVNFFDFSDLDHGKQAHGLMLTIGMGFRDFFL